MMRERLPNRRGSTTFEFEHDGHRYRATVSFYPDGRLAELFLDSGKAGSAVQQQAETAAILVSLALQHGVQAAVIQHATFGPIAAALGEAAR